MFREVIVNETNRVKKIADWEQRFSRRKGEMKMSCEGCHYAEVEKVKSCQDCDNSYMCRRTRNSMITEDAIWLNNGEVAMIAIAIAQMRKAGIKNWKQKDMETICDFAKIGNEWKRCKTKTKQITTAIKAAWILGFSTRDLTNKEKAEIEKISARLKQQINNYQKHEILGEAEDGRKYCIKCGLYEEYCNKPCIPQ